MDPLYLYENAVQLVQGAQMMSQTDLNRRKLFSAAIKILWSLQDSQELPTRKAELLLAELLVRETSSLKLAHTIITESLNDVDLNDMQILQFRLLEMEAYLKEGNTRAAARSVAQAELLDVPATLKEVVYLSKLQLGPITNEECEVLLNSTPEIKVMANVLLDQKLQDKTCSQGIKELQELPQELMFMDSLFRVCSSLAKGDIKDAEALAIDLRDIDWTNFWTGGNLVFEKQQHMIEVSWHGLARVSALYYLVLTVVHFVTEEQGCTVTQKWASELLRDAAEQAPDQQTLDSIYFYSALIYHHGGRFSIRDVVLAQFEKLVHNNPSSARLCSLRYCQAIVAQSEGRKADAMKLYAYVYEHGNTEFKACSLVNQLTIVKSKDLMDKLQALDAPASIETSLQLLKLFNEESAGENLEALRSSSWSPLQKTLIDLFAVSLPGVSPDEKAQRLEKIVSSFNSMALTNWENHSQRLLDSVSH